MPETASWYHASVAPVSRSKGKSAVGAVAYITGERLKDDSSSEWRTRGHPGEVLGWGSTAPPGAPAYLTDPAQIGKAWNDVQRSEKRINSHLCQHLNFALSREFSETDNALVCQHAAQKITDRYGVLATWAVHAPTDHGDERNSHGHIVFSLREIDKHGFGSKVESLTRGREGKKAELKWQRDTIAEVINERLALIGSNERVTSQSYKDRGIVQEPTKHLGNKQNQSELQGLATPKGDENREIRERNRAYEAEIIDFKERQVERILKGNPMSDTDRRAGFTEQDFRQQPEAEEKLAMMLKAQKERAIEVEKELQRRVEEDKKREAQLKEAEEQRAKEGGLTNANARYSMALGREYDIRDPYGSMARAAMTEYGMFIKQQEDYKRQASLETDPDKRHVIDLKREIEAYDYMALTSDRLAGQSYAITGKRHEREIEGEPTRKTQYEVQSERAEEFRSEATTHREELRDFEREKRNREMDEFDNQIKKATGRDHEPLETKDKDQELTEEQQAKLDAHRQHYRENEDRIRERGEERERGGGGRSY